ncbi:MAG: hypothetical protein RBS01_03875 [Candidatus Dojkabacteria bacterium]|jgi:hypothetical protein|nr:hypothetical protein [Candidatus Dojkabacteria bacterium]
MLDIFRRYFIVLLLAIIILIVWGGIILLSDKRNSTLNPNAEIYTKPLNGTFNEEILDTVAKRTTDSFPILPSSFFELDTD